MLRLAHRTTALGAICASVALFGCGGGGDKAAGPLDDALGYLPKDAPFAVSIQTDLKGGQAKNIEKIIEKFPFAGQLKQGIKGSLDNQSVNFDRDLKPLLGNEFVVGASDARSLTDNSGSREFVAAIEVKSKSKLEDALKKEKAKENGEKSGAKLYKDSSGDAFAIKDDVLVVAGTRKQLESALEQRKADDRLTEKAFDAGTAKLPKDAAVRVYANLQTLIASDPSTKDARKIKWVAALRTLGVTASFKADEADVDFRVGTDPNGLTAEDLPLAAGAASPAVIDRAGEIGLGLRDPGQIYRFVESALQSASPASFGNYETAKQTLEKRSGVSIQRDVIDQLEGDVAVSAGVDGRFGLRATVKDPAGFKRTLNRVGKVLPELAKNATGGTIGYAKPKKGEDFYALAKANGKSVVYGVVKGKFVLANDPQRAGRLANEPTKPVTGATGSVVLSADAEKLVTQAIARSGSAGIQGIIGGSLFAGPLGELTGSVESGTDGLTGKLKLSFD